MKDGSGARKSGLTSQKLLGRVILFLTLSAALVFFAWPPRYLGVQNIFDCYRHAPGVDIKSYLAQLDRVTDPITGFCKRPNLYRHGSAWLLAAWLVGACWLTIRGYICLFRGYICAFQAANGSRRLWLGMLCVLLGSFGLFVSIVLSLPEVV